MSSYQNQQDLVPCVSCHQYIVELKMLDTYADLHVLFDLPQPRGLGTDARSS